MTEQARAAAFRERNAIPALIDVHVHFMPERLLAAVWAYFDAGTDFPNMPHSYPDALEALERTGLGPGWLRAVCHDNAAGLFGL